MSEELDRIEALVKANAEAISALEKKVEKWDERLFQLNQNGYRTSLAIIITAGGVVIFSPVLQALSPVLEQIAQKTFGL